MSKYLNCDCWVVYCWVTSLRINTKGSFFLALFERTWPCNRTSHQLYPTSQNVQVQVDQLAGLVMLTVAGVFPQLLNNIYCIIFMSPWYYEVLTPEVCTWRYPFRSSDIDNCGGSVLSKFIILMWTRIGQVPWHEDLTCAEFQAIPSHEREPEDLCLKALARSKNWQRCARCRFVVELTAGCQHISCRYKTSSISQFRSPASTVSTRYISSLRFQLLKRKSSVCFQDFSNI